MHDKTFNGRKLKILTIMDEFTRECLHIKVSRSITASSVIDSLEWLFLTRGVPNHIRSDNGPEFIATRLVTWLRNQQVSTVFIKPGSPWENCFIERFNGTLRDELLDIHVFMNGPEAQIACEAFREEYNHIRPHSSHDYQPPSKFASEYGHSNNTLTDASSAKRITPGKACHAPSLPTLASSSSQVFSLKGSSK